MTTIEITAQTKPLPTAETVTITKRLKRELRFSFEGANYVLNVHGVVGLVTKLEGGREWFSYTNLPYLLECDLRDALSKGRDRIGYIYV